MNRFLKGAALLAAITCGVWLAMLWRWDSTRRDVTAADIGLYLAVLPLTVFGVLLGLRWAWRGAGGRREAALAAAAERRPATSGDPGASALPGEAQRHATVQVLSAHVASSVGATPADIWTALAEPGSRPELDAELRDGDGLAVMCARIDGLPLDAVSEELTPVLVSVRARRPEWAALAPEDHVVRALAILVEPLASALESLHPWTTRLGAVDPDAVHRPAPRPPDETASRVRLLLGWPEPWTEFEREVASEWTRLFLRARTAVPIDRFIVVAQACASGEELLLRADQLLQTLAREARSDLVVVAACHSDLSDPAIGLLEQQQRLFSALHRPKGSMPGEAAAVLVLANPDWPADPQADRPSARLHRAALMRRDKSIDASGRTSSECLQHCIDQALGAAGIEPGAVPALVCDADQHTPRGAELYGAALSRLPHLDPSVALRLVGVAAGRIGIAGALLTIAVAAEQARVESAPCLALCVGDAYARLAVVALPAETPPVTGAAEPA